PPRPPSGHARGRRAGPASPDATVQSRSFASWFTPDIRLRVAYCVLRVPSFNRQHVIEYRLYSAETPASRVPEDAVRQTANLTRPQNREGFPGAKPPSSASPPHSRYACGEDGRAACAGL